MATGYKTWPGAVLAAGLPASGADRLGESSRSANPIAAALLEHLPAVARGPESVPRDTAVALCDHRRSGRTNGQDDAQSRGVRKRRLLHCNSWVALSFPLRQARAPRHAHVKRPAHNWPVRPSEGFGAACDLPTVPPGNPAETSSGRGTYNIDSTPRLRDGETAESTIHHPSAFPYTSRREMRTGGVFEMAVLVRHGWIAACVRVSAIDAMIIFSGAAGQEESPLRQARIDKNATHTL